ncbi:DUF1822 family protein [Lusitaniella coriacea LEGE 07157]|uniref:DUF1822 family protein n=1 Tax=Lusitaniella coriacea LEGE 07157 TaxID=945747 RepID=A0A8J7DU06_9CYAN|nr:DUF1822 family protein [Lusitaniella coriacea]MBE9114681.1 DUF1822 family protein [Lusitaniella coriacea LEGE 07157]
MNNIASPQLMVPILQQARDLAQRFAAEQATPEKGVRVYLNTLAVWAVSRYLTWLQVETDLDRGESWNSRSRAVFDVADLVIPNWGKIACRPVLKDENYLVLPSEARQNRRGAIAVQIDESLQSVQILGFHKAVAGELPERISLERLESLDRFLESLERTVENEAITNLSQWLQDSFDRTWQQVEQLLTAKTPAFAFRNSAIRRVKRLELDESLALMMAIEPDSDERVNIDIQIQPIARDVTLPPQTQLTILTELNEVFRVIVAGERSRGIQYQLRGEVGERFGLRIASDTASVTETFVI